MYKILVLCICYIYCRIDNKATMTRLIYSKFKQFTTTTKKMFLFLKVTIRPDTRRRSLSLIMSPCRSQLVSACSAVQCSSERSPLPPLDGCVQCASGTSLSLALQSDLTISLGSMAQAERASKTGTWPSVH